MIAVFTPTRDLVHAGFAYDLAQLIRQDADVLFALTQGTYLQNLRTGAARMAVQQRMSHVLFIDSDMRFPPDVARRLRFWNLPIVGANCRQRTQNAWTARKGGVFVSSEGRVGLQQVDSLGFGVTLVATAVFKTLPEPWFDMPWDAASGKHVGEDVSFCLKAKAAGIPIHIDHTLSQDVRHAKLVEL